MTALSADIAGDVRWGSGCGRVPATGRAIVGRADSLRVVLARDTCASACCADDLISTVADYDLAEVLFHRLILIWPIMGRAYRASQQARSVWS